MEYRRDCPGEAGRRTADSRLVCSCVCVVWWVLWWWATIGDACRTVGGCFGGGRLGGCFGGGLLRVLVLAVRRCLVAAAVTALRDELRRRLVREHRLAAPGGVKFAQARLALGRCSGTADSSESVDSSELRASGTETPQGGRDEHTASRHCQHMGSQCDIYKI